VKNKEKDKKEKENKKKTQKKKREKGDVFVGEINSWSLLLAHQCIDSKAQSF